MLGQGKGVRSPSLFSKNLRGILSAYFTSTKYQNFFNYSITLVNSTFPFPPFSKLSILVWNVYSPRVMCSHCMITGLYDVKFHTRCVFVFLLNQKVVSHFLGLLHYDGNAHVLLALGIFKLRVH